MVMKKGLEITELRNSMNRNYSHTAIYLLSELDPLIGQSTNFIIINFAYFNTVCGNIGLFNLCLQHMHAHMFMCVHMCVCSKKPNSSRGKFHCYTTSILPSESSSHP